MTLSFAETRVQTQTLNKISFWLKPPSRAFLSAKSTAITIDDFEELCGPIRNVRFDEDLAVEIVLNTALDMAEGFIVEHAATLGFKLSEFPVEYSLVSRLPNGEPGKELALTLAVVHLIIDGNELISARAEISQRLEKLKETMDELEEGGSDIPKIFNSIEDRIANCDEVSETEIQEFIDQIEKDQSYYTHLIAFVNHEYLLKGARHVQFLQNAYKNTTTINMSFYTNVFSTMESVVKRLSNEELEIALVASVKYFEEIRTKKRDYVSDFKQVINSEKSVVALTARLLILGPIVVCPELGSSLNESYSDRDGKSKWIALVSAMPLPLHKMLLEGTLCGHPYLLMNLFSMRAGSLFCDDNFVKPMDCLVKSGTFPLHKLLNMMLKDSQNFKRHFVRLFNCYILKRCIENAKRKEEWDETVQGMITAISIVATPESGIGKETIKNLVHILKKNSLEKMDELEWLSKYEHHEKVAELIGLLTKPDESTGEDSAVAAEMEGEEIEKTQEDEDTEEEQEEKTEKESDEEKEEIDGMEGKEEGEANKEEKGNAVEAETVEDNKDGQMLQNIVCEVQKGAEGLDEESVVAPCSLDKTEEEEEHAGVDGSDEKKEEGETGEEEESAVSTLDAADKRNDQAPDGLAEGSDEERGSKRRQVNPQNLTDDSADEIFPQVETEDENEERLEATQSSTYSQDVGGFSDSINSIDQIGKA